MRSAAKRKIDLPERREVTARSAPKPKLDAVRDAPGAAERKLKVFHASVQVTRVEEWFVEAETADEARRLIESGQGQRSQIGECLYFSVDRVID